MLPATEQKNTEEKTETKVAETPKKLEEKKEDSKISTELKNNPFLNDQRLYTIKSGVIT